MIAQKVKTVELNLNNCREKIILAEILPMQ
jgi:hypothetical protein